MSRYEYDTFSVMQRTLNRDVLDRLKVGDRVRLNYTHRFGEIVAVNKRCLIFKVSMMNFWRYFAISKRLSLKKGDARQETYFFAEHHKRSISERAIKELATNIKLYGFDEKFVKLPVIELVALDIMNTELKGGPLLWY